MPLFVQQLFNLIAKDIRIEYRSRQTLGLVLVLGLLIIVVLGLGLGGGIGRMPDAGSVKSVQLYDIDALDEVIMEHRAMRCVPANKFWMKKSPLSTHG